MTDQQKRPVLFYEMIDIVYHAVSMPDVHIMLFKTEAGGKSSLLSVHINIIISYFIGKR